MTLPAGSQFDPYEILSPFGKGRTEDARLPITVVVEWAPEGRK